jgi:hypothetical protein
VHPLFGDPGTSDVTGPAVREPSMPTIAPPAAISPRLARPLPFSPVPPARRSASDALYAEVRDRLLRDLPELPFPAYGGGGGSDVDYMDVQRFSSFQAGYL